MKVSAAIVSAVEAPFSCGEAPCEIVVGLRTPLVNVFGKISMHISSWRWGWADAY